MDSDSSLPNIFILFPLACRQFFRVYPINATGDRQKFIVYGLCWAVCNRGEEGANLCSPPSLQSRNNTSSSVHSPASKMRQSLSIRKKKRGGKVTSREECGEWIRLFLFSSKAQSLLVNYSRKLDVSDGWRNSSVCVCVWQHMKFETGLKLLECWRDLQRRARELRLLEIKKVDVLSIVPGRGCLSLFKRDKSGNNCLKEGEREKELNERQSGAEPVNLIKSSIFSFEKDLLGKEQRQDKANTNFSRRRKRDCSKIHWSLTARKRSRGNGTRRSLVASGNDQEEAWDLWEF